MTDDPDEDCVVATLLEDAAQLATAVNAKLAEALAIAEQQRRDAAFNEDRRWFKSRAGPQLPGSARHGARGRGLAQ